MKYLSVCSGIEAATAAWHPLGWEPVGFAEIEKFPSAVLAHHYPSVPNYGDMTKFKDWPLNAQSNIDLLVGGTPCQAFSVAGLRRGLSDPRGNLTLTFLGLVDRYQPRWVVWENVPGVLSDRTNAFGQFLAGLAQLGYGWAYRVLDAQHFGVPQRRRRVFVVGCLGDWRSAAEVLFERESVLGNPAPSREKRKDIALTISARNKGGGGLGTDFDCDGGLVTAHTLKAEGHDASEDGTGRGVPLWPVEVAPTLNAHFGDKQGLEDQHALNGGGISYPPPISRSLNAGAMGRLDAETETLIPTRPGGFFDSAIAFSSKDHGADAGELSPTLRAGNHTESHANAGCPPAVAFETRFARNGRGAPSEVVPPLKAQSGETGKGDAAPCVIANMAVRRLTPVECERLQGFPDNYTNIPWRQGRAITPFPRGPKRESCPDGPRYKALGNSMAVPVMRWIGQRIQAVETLPDFP